MIAGAIGNAIRGKKPRLSLSDRSRALVRLHQTWRAGGRRCAGADVRISIEAAPPELDLGIMKDVSGKTIVLGVVELGDEMIETPQVVADRIRAALKFIDAKRLIPAPDCGMKYLSRASAFGKLKALSDGAAIVKGELG